MDGPRRVARGASARSQHAQAPKLVLDVGVRPIVAAFRFLMPSAGAVLVLDRAPLPRRALLLRCSRGGGVSRLVSGEGLRKDVADLVGPSAVVLDDRVGDMAHGGRNLPRCNFALTRASVS